MYGASGRYERAVLASAIQSALVSRGLGGGACKQGNGVPVYHCLVVSIILNTLGMIVAGLLGLRNRDRLGYSFESYF